MVLTDLEGNIAYFISVKGFNSIGQGPASAAVTAKTRKSREFNTDSNHETLFTEHMLPGRFAWNWPSWMELSISTMECE